MSTFHGDAFANENPLAGRGAHSIFWQDDRWGRTHRDPDNDATCDQRIAHTLREGHQLREQAGD